MDDKKFSIWTKAAVGVALAIASLYGLKKPIQESVCSTYYNDVPFVKESK